MLSAVGAAARDNDSDFLVRRGREPKLDDTGCDDLDLECRYGCPDFPLRMPISADTICAAISNSTLTGCGCRQQKPQRQELMKKHVIAIYPGSFDPLTNGHLDLIHRGAKLFDELIVAILDNPDKDPLFSPVERREMLEAMTSHYDNVRVEKFDGLLVEFAKSVHANVIVRGIRAISDYEYELQMALMNHKLDPHIDTVFMPSAEAYSYVSSRLVKGIARLGGPVHGFVPALVEEHLHRKLNGKARRLKVNVESDNSRKNGKQKQPTRKATRTRK